MSQLKIFVGICFAVFAGVGNLARASDDFHFGYDGESGPDHWADHFGKCAGKYQSPINIEEHLVQMVQLLPMTFTGYDVAPEKTTLTNNGHTVMLQLSPPKTASLAGGPLKDKYLFSQMHFHWGYNDTFGSEDLINNQSFPMELHVVSYNSKYPNDSEAGNYDDGLVVMAFFFEVSEKDNENYNEIVEKLSDVVEPEQTTALTVQLPLNALIGADRTQYYTYHGSLTTPPCSEVVTWIDFTQPILLSHAQLEQFRKLRTSEGPMTHNNRPTQPLGGRLIWHNERDRDPNQKGTGESGPRSSATHIIALFSLTIVALATSFAVSF